MRNYSSLTSSSESGERFKLLKHELMSVIFYSPDPGGRLRTHLGLNVNTGTFL